MIRAAIPVLHVASMEIAEAFYHQLGFHSHFAYRIDEARADPCYQGFHRDGVWLHVSSFPGDGVAGNAVNLMVDDMDALHDDLKQRGLALDMEPMQQTWGNRELYLEDPDGNSIRFVQEG
ncbi:MAG: glyoxalase superfamily protein [Planctomycetota bacterium]